MRSEVWKEDKEREEKRENGEESDPSEVGELWVGRKRRRIGWSEEALADVEAMEERVKGAMEELAREMKQEDEKEDEER